MFKVYHQSAERRKHMKDAPSAERESDLLSSDSGLSRDQTSHTPPALSSEFPQNRIHTEHKRIINVFVPFS